MTSIPSKHDDDTSWIPEGYEKVLGPNSDCFVVPHFFVSALHQNLAGQREKTDLNIGNAPGSVSFNYSEI
jgi:hypothetical protein